MRTKSFFYYSLLAALVPTVADAGIRVGNLSRNNAQGYQQVNEMRYGAVETNQAAAAAVAAIPAELPIAVANAKLAQQIRDNDADAPIGISDLERCSMIYPNGEFAWAKPTLGVGTGGAAKCTAVVELRAIGMGEDGGDAILARANLGAGDTFNCNISEFNDVNWLPAAGMVEFPADREPTIDDVVEVLNREQRQNAGIKIAAGTVLAGVAGNIVGESKPGSDSLLGGGRAKTQSTIVGALSGAAIMAGNVYAGKVAGDMILSTGVNAAAGGVVGNIVASGDSVLRIEPCLVDDKETKCLWGVIEQVSDINGPAYVSATNINDFRVCDADGKNCTRQDLASAIVAEYSGKKRLSDNAPMELVDMLAEDWSLVDTKYCYINNEMTPWVSSNCTDGPWIRLESAKLVARRLPAMVVNVRDKAFGWKKTDWNDFKAGNQDAIVVGRSGNGIATNLNPRDLISDATDDTKITLSAVNFRPVYQDSDDGGVIDLDNKARLKSTLTGAGVGGAMGAFTAYQGAQSDIDERWVSAVREYKDSLQKFYCATGKRFLSYYNDVVAIPAMSEK